MAERTLEVNLIAKDRMSKAVKGSSASFDKLGKKLIQVGVAYVGFRAATRAAGKVVRQFTEDLKEGIRSAGEYEQAAIRLAQAMRSSKNFSQSAYESFLSQAAALSRLTNYTENEILAAQAMLATFKLAPDILRTATQLTLDMAAATGADLVQASVLMGKAAVGVTGTLSKYGIIIDQTELKLKGFQAVVEEMSKEFGGQAQIVSQTYVGALKNLTDAYADLWREIGRLITQSPAVRAVFEAMLILIDKLMAETPKMAETIDRYLNKFILYMYDWSVVFIDQLDLLVTQFRDTFQGLFGQYWKLIELQLKWEKTKSDTWAKILGMNKEEESVLHGVSDALAENKLVYEEAHKFHQALLDVDRATTDDLPKLRMEIDNLTEAIFLQGHASEFDARMLDALERKIKDLAATGAEAVPAIKEPEYKPAKIRGERREIDIEPMRHMIDMPEMLANKWNTTTGRVMEIQQEFMTEYLDMKTGQFEYEWNLLQADYDHYQKFILDKDVLASWLHDRQVEYWTSVAQTSIGLMADTTSAMAQSGMISGRVAQRSAQIQAMVDAYASANAAMRAMSGIPIVGPILGYAAFAATLAKGLASVRIIEKQKYHEGGGIPGYGERMIIAEGGEKVIPRGPAQRYGPVLDSMVAEGRGGGIPGPALGGQTIIHQHQWNVSAFDGESIYNSVKHGPIGEIIRTSMREEYL